ncbi:MAG: hypothetical protein IT453_19505 [Planctomycetes bacterium]|nr:hypothetical protein [Planctomycetota bacterium]
MLVAGFFLPACEDYFDIVKNEIEDIFLGEDDDGTTAFEPHTTKLATLSSSKIVFANHRFVYLANEAASGKNFNAKNGDASFTDNCAVVVNMKTRRELPLNVDTKSAEFVGRHLYLAVSERDDSWDWNQDGDVTDTVLLHYPGKGGGSPSAPDVEYLDDLDASATTPFLLASDRLYYAADRLQPLAGGETNLKWLDRDAPTTPTRVLHNVTASSGGGCHVRLSEVDEELLFLVISEFVEAVDHNNDGDTDDPAVLALLDSTDVAAEVLSTELCMENVASPVRARTLGAGDWLVAFLVSEGQQADFTTGLNDAVGLGFPAGWEPTSCGGYDDTDTADEVLHFLTFAAWAADPIASPVQNTGLAGINRVLAVPGFVGTTVLESADGSDMGAGGCDANGDGDVNDAIFRWTSTATPLQPFNDPAELVAMTVVGGNSDGISDLDDRFLCIVDENADSRNHDNDSNVDNLLLAWMDPTLGVNTVWNFDREPSKAGIQSAIVTWMSDREKRDRVLVDIAEQSFGKTQNKSWKDKDVLDEVPAFAYFPNSDPDRFVFPRGPAALSAGNGGLVQAKNSVFFRVSEASDTRDWNRDNIGSFMLVRTTLSHQGLDYVSPLNNLAQPSVSTDGRYGAAFLVQEQLVNTDYNHDGDKADFVVRWIRINP